MVDMIDNDDLIYEEEQRQINEIFGDTEFTISIALDELDELLTERNRVIIKSDYKCYCYDNEPRNTDYFIICGDSITIKYVFLELKRQGLHLECNHHFIEGFQKDSDVQYSFHLGS
jgi:hypothetical protein